MITPPPQHILVGRLGAPYGVRGWIKVHSFTDPIDNLLQYPTWKIHHADQWQSIPLEESKHHHQGLIVKWVGCDNREQARCYTNDWIAVARTTFAPLREGDYYWADLIGLQVITLSGVHLGVIDALLATGANDVIRIIDKKNKRERLLPYVRSTVVHSIDLDKRIMIVDWDSTF
ncbi:MAG: hypothetical protein A3F41_02215 [Coxiella sp. RIFCSPHIGHO2_12_FULL_44_14]|nr:MAG: hypothetical protein A3F41_02215 [Coxiella sp. RIFCSPHIGHO2_12_FULL_44_14]